MDKKPTVTSADLLDPDEKDVGSMLAVMQTVARKPGEDRKAWRARMRELKASLRRKRKAITK